MFDNELLRAFVGVAEGGGFTRAAERLHLTQSAVSAQIKRLETQTGCALLTRSTRSVALTPQGEILLEYARNILALHEGIRMRLGSARHIGGPLRIGASEGCLGGWLADVLQRLKVDHPAVELTLHIGITGTLIEALNDAHLDVVLGITCGNPTTDAEVLWTEALVWAFSESANIDPSQPLPMCFFPEPCPFRAAAVAALGITDAHWRVACVSPSAAGVHAAASFGFGVTPMLRSQLDSGLCDVGGKLGLPALPPAEFAIWSSPHARSPAVLQLVEAVRYGARRRQEIQSTARVPASPGPLQRFQRNRINASLKAARAKAPPSVAASRPRESSSALKR
jgi:DNA-binding transcriptional LysR family regulator